MMQKICSIHRLKGEGERKKKTHEQEANRYETMEICLLAAETGRGSVLRDPRRAAGVLRHLHAQPRLEEGAVPHIR